MATTVRLKQLQIGDMVLIPDTDAPTWDIRHKVTRIEKVPVTEQLRVYVSQYLYCVDTACLLDDSALGPVSAGVIRTLEI